MKKAYCEIPFHQMERVSYALEQMGIQGKMVMPFGKPAKVDTPTTVTTQAPAPQLPLFSRRKRKSNKGFTYAHGIRNKGITGRQLVLDILGSEVKVFHRDEINRGFVLRGFKDGSFSAPLSELYNEGKVERIGDGLWALPGVLEKVTNPKSNGVSQSNL